MRFIRKSIKHRITFINTCAISLTVSFIILNIIIIAQKQITEQTVNYCMQVLKQSNLNLNRYFENYEKGFLNIIASQEYSSFLNINDELTATVYYAYKEVESKYIHSFVLNNPDIISISLTKGNKHQFDYSPKRFVNSGIKYKDIIAKKSGSNRNVEMWLNEWHNLPISSKDINIIMIIVKYYTNTEYLVANITNESMLEVINEIDLAKLGHAMIVDAHGRIIAQNGSGETQLTQDIADRLNEGVSGSFDNSSKNLYIFDTISYNGWKTVLSIPKKEIFSLIYFLRNLIIIITLISLCVSTISISVIISRVIKRITELRDVIRSINDGSISRLINIVGEDEITELGVEYNKMMRRLRITIDNLVSEKLMHQQTVLSALQAQINSHFLYNTLESINSMAGMAGHAQIEKVSIALARMFRYTSNYKEKVVSIEDEISHFINYMEITRARFGALVSYDIEAADECLKTPCLKVIIQPLAENAIKHNVEAMEKPIHISLNIEAQRDGKIAIYVADNGTGFSPEKIAAINASSEMAEQMESSHIGLFNIKKRIRMFYNDDVSSMRIYNSPEGGAVVEVIFTSLRIKFEPES